MNDALRMDRVEAMCDLRGNRKRGENRQRATLAQGFLQGFSRDEFHRIEELAGVVVEKKHAGDIWVADAGRGARLAQEQRLRLWIIDPGGVNQFQRDLNAQALVVRLVGDTHGPEAKAPRRSIRVLQHAIMGEAQGRRRGHRAQASRRRPTFASSRRNVNPLFFDREAASDAG